MRFRRFAEKGPVLSKIPTRKEYFDYLFPKLWEEYKFVKSQHNQEDIECDFRNVDEPTHFQSVAIQRCWRRQRDIDLTICDWILAYCVYFIDEEELRGNEQNLSLPDVKFLHSLKHSTRNAVEKRKVSGAFVDKKMGGFAHLTKKFGPEQVRRAPKKYLNNDGLFDLSLYEKAGERYTLSKIYNDEYWKEYIIFILNRGYDAIQSSMRMYLKMKGAIKRWISQGATEATAETLANLGIGADDRIFDLDYPRVFNILKNENLFDSFVLEEGESYPLGDTPVSLEIKKLAWKRGENFAKILQNIFIELRRHTSLLEAHSTTSIAQKCLKYSDEELKNMVNKAHGDYFFVAFALFDKDVLKFNEHEKNKFKQIQQILNRGYDVINFAKLMVDVVKILPDKVFKEFLEFDKSQSVLIPKNSIVSMLSNLIYTNPLGYRSRPKDLSRNVKKFEESLGELAKSPFEWYKIVGKTHLIPVITNVIERVYRYKRGTEEFNSAMHMLLVEPSLVSVNPKDFHDAVNLLRKSAIHRSYGYSNYEHSDINAAEEMIKNISKILLTFKKDWKQALINFSMYSGVDNMDAALHNFGNILPKPNLRDIKKVKMACQKWTPKLSTHTHLFTMLLNKISDLPFEAVMSAKSIQEIKQIIIDAESKEQPEGVRSPEFYKEYITHKNLSDDYSDNSDATYEQLEDCYTSGLSVPLPSWAKVEPYKLELGAKKYYIGRFLPRNDPRGMFLGIYTGCCQHPWAEASSCAFHGQSGHNGAFFVIENEKGDIIAQSWAWEADNGDVVFDNVEGVGIQARSAYIYKIYEEIARRIPNNVKIGMGYSKLNFAHLPSATPAPMPQHMTSQGIYSDAYNQKLLKEKEGRVYESDPTKSSESQADVDSDDSTTLMNRGLSRPYWADIDLTTASKRTLSNMIRQSILLDACGQYEKADKIFGF